MKIDELKKGLVLLNISEKKWNSATQEDRAGLLRIEFLKKARLWHPDKTGSLPEKERIQLTEQFKIINNCFTEIDQVVKMNIGITVNQSSNKQTTKNEPKASPPSKQTPSKPATQQKESSPAKQTPSKSTTQQERTLDPGQYNVSAEAARLIDELLPIVDDLSHRLKQRAPFSDNEGLKDTQTEAFLKKLHYIKNDLFSLKYGEFKEGKPFSKVNKKTGREEYFQRPPNSVKNKFCSNLSDLPRFQTDINVLLDKIERRVKQDSVLKLANEEFRPLLERFLTGLNKLLNFFRREPVMMQTKTESLYSDMKTKFNSIREEVKKSEIKNDETQTTNKP